MIWIIEHIESVLLVSGVLTCSMLFMALAPRAAMRLTFGEAADGALALLIARSWGGMIFASGLMLIYAAWHAEARLPILLFSIAGKAVFVLLVLAQPRLRRPALLTVVADSAIVALLSWYLLASA